MYSRGNRHQDNITANPSKYPQGFFNSKKCRECSSEFNLMAPSHLYCSEHCVSLANTRKYLKKNYGISYEDYMDLYNKHDGKCHICLQSGFRIDVNQKLDLAVDHCHTTGAVRGMLCHNCNRALGLFKDSTSSLKRAIDYLERATTIPTGSTVQANGTGSAQGPINGL